MAGHCGKEGAQELLPCTCSHPHAQAAAVRGHLHLHAARELVRLGWGAPPQAHFPITAITAPPP